jgi:hypothetical protein
MIGMFLRGAARQQEANVALRELLEGVHVSDVMRPYLGWSRPVEVPGAKVAPTDDLVSALPALSEAPEQELPVVENGVLVGKLFTEDVTRFLMQRPPLRPSQAV